MKYIQSRALEEPCAPALILRWYQRSFVGHVIVSWQPVASFFCETPPSLRSSTSVSGLLWRQLLGAVTTLWQVQKGLQLYGKWKYLWQVQKGLKTRHTSRSLLILLRALCNLYLESEKQRQRTPSSLGSGITQVCPIFHNMATSTPTLLHPHPFFYIITPSCISSYSIHLLQ